MTHLDCPPDGRLVLASASPRRQDLLVEAGIAHTVVVSGVQESPRIRGESCDDYAMRLAADKASAVAETMPGRWVLGADTIVVLDDEVLSKPADAADATRMLRRLSGRAHRVITGIALARRAPGAGRALIQRSVQTHVRFLNLSEAQVSEYVASGEPLDKAGAYGIQGLGGALVAEYDGSYTNVVGLPLEAVKALLAAHTSLVPSVLPARHDSQ